MNYFELFGIPEKPVVNQAEIAGKYFALQRASHPDFYSQASEEEKALALQQSADANEGYRIFKNAHATLGYFLKLKGSITADEKFELPPDFLMEMMEINEAIIEEGEQAVLHKVQQHENSLTSDLLAIIKEDRDITDTQMHTLKAFYYKHKYLRRILDRMTD